MAYPEPIPVVKNNDAKEFDMKLRSFRLNSAQKEFYREALRIFGSKKKK